MITLNLENLFNVKDPQVNREEFSEEAKKLSEYLENIKKKGQGFYTVVQEDPDEVWEHVKTGWKPELIVLLGIGGSALGMRCIRDTLELPNDVWTSRLYILDNIDPYKMEELVKTLEGTVKGTDFYDMTLFITISKSGQTPETIAQYSYFRKKTDELKLDPKKHHIFITGKSGFLRETGERDDIKIFDIPENVGGRFSVLTAVGLLPTATMEGINIFELVKGARDFSRIFLSENFEENLCFRLAAIQYLANKNGININVLMPYSSRLKTFGDWYAQLLAESIGKDGKGITPVSALGVTDQHSQLQLYNEGPRDKMIMFLEVKDHGSKIEIPESTDYLSNVSFEKLLHTEFKATRDAVTNYGKANLTITIDKVDAYHLGALFMLFEGATAFLGEFFEVDAFNQPGVELGKKLTKKYLEEKK